jgi:hypothetical protein
VSALSGRAAIAATMLATLLGVGGGVALPVGPALAEVAEVRATGRAVATGAGGERELRRRALEEALFEAAIAGGADVTGFTASDRSAIVSDQLVLRPASRILDYAILSEERSGEILTITIRALVGEVAPAGTCPRDVRLDVTALRPRLQLAPDAPAWGQRVLEDVSRRLLDALDNHRAVTLSRSDAIAGAPAKASTIDAAFDYTALTTGSRTQAVASHGLAYAATVTLGRAKSEGGRDALELVVDSRLGDVRRTLRETYLLPRKTPIEALNALTAPDRRTIAQALAQGARPHVEALVRAHVCRPLEGRLRASGDGALSLPFGRAHGLTRGHIAYTEGRDTPYTLLEIVDLGEHSVTLRPIDRRRGAGSLAGAHVRFMETDG